MSRKINWVSAIDKNRSKELSLLQNQMQDFYRNSDSYYHDIDFTYNVWADPEKLLQQDLLQTAHSSRCILEIGCGKANILKKNSDLESRYTGVDFSEKLMLENAKLYSRANFAVIKDPVRFDLPAEKFDLVFSHFVIEHTVYPNFFLDECLRLLKKDGTLAIICPDFLGFNSIPSQRVGFSQGSGRQKLAKGKILDAIVTGFDSKWRLPAYCRKIRKMAKASPMFMINLNPTCFTDPFQPDVDAVYVAYEYEIKNYCTTIHWQPQPDSIKNYCKSNRLIYLKGIRT